jgi:hypothetical protein
VFKTDSYVKSLAIIKGSLAECSFPFHASRIAATATKQHSLTLPSPLRLEKDNLWQATFILAEKF